MHSYSMLGNSTVLKIEMGDFFLYGRIGPFNKQLKPFSDFTDLNVGY